MFEGKDVRVILANAGTGKTRRLIEEVSEELETRRPEELAFVTFTRKGAEEGLHRVCSKLVLTPDDLPYFRTLHSLTFHALGLKANQMFGLLDQRKFNKEFGYEVNRCEVDTGKVSPTRDTQYLNFYDLERSGALTSRQLAEADIEIGYYRQLVRKYEEYKANEHLVDFFDCLIKYVQEGDSLPCKVVFIDEAQDISALQWKVIDKAFSKAEKIVICGDDKQSIYTYSGARPDYLIDLAKQYPVEHLSVSYRIPYSVYKLSVAITNFIGDKTEQKAEPRMENGEGSITQLPDLERLKNFIREEDYAEDKSEASWYILSRNNCFLERPERLLEENLIPYLTAEGFFMGGQIMKRLKDYEGYKLEGYGNPKKREDFQRRFGIEDFRVPFTDTCLFTEGRKWVYASYIEKFGLKKLEEMCKWNPQILVSTIHHVKGGEAQNVAVMLDTTRRTVGNIYNDIDEELRILYVGVTRTKQNLFLIDSKNGLGYDKLLNVIKEENKLEW
jgi:superfamily I DNA/RNA helicase